MGIAETRKSGIKCKHLLENNNFDGALDLQTKYPSLSNDTIVVILIITTANHHHHHHHYLQNNHHHEILI